jgi:hypothetical protein
MWRPTEIWRPTVRRHPLLFRALLAGFVSGLLVWGAVTPAAAGPTPPETLPTCKVLLSPAAPTLFGSPVTELAPVTLVATWDPVIKIILYDNVVRNCRWSAVYGKVIVDFTLAYITPAERAQIRERWLTAYGQPGVNVGGDNWINHRTMPGYVESAAVLDIPYYVTAVANDGTYFPAFIQDQADRARMLLL